MTGESIRGVNIQEEVEMTVNRVKPGHVLKHAA